MIGSKKLAEIRAELRSVLQETGEDPLVWLERRMSSPEFAGRTGKNEVLQSLDRLLKTPGKKRGRRK